MSYDDNVMMVKVAFEKGAVGSLHSHYHTQISYVESGALR
jgi:quercetin dioxygenase-like cupin family protein